VFISTIQLHAFDETIFKPDSALFQIFLSMIIDRKTLPQYLLVPIAD
jgi:hypothetical protein